MRMTATKRVDVTNAARALWWHKKGDLLASAIAGAVVLIVGAVSGTWPLAVTLAALTAGNVVRLFIRGVATERDDRDLHEYFEAAGVAYFAELDATIGHAPANGDTADV